MLLPHGLGTFLFTVSLCIGFTSGQSVSTTVTPGQLTNKYLCPTGFDLVSNGQCRGFVEQLNYESAKIVDKSIEVCSALNGFPPIVKNAEEHEYWTKFPAHISNSNSAILLGIICKSGKWVWADGSKIDYRPPQYDSDLDDACTVNKPWYYSRNNPRWHYCSACSDTEHWEINCITELEKPELIEDDCINFDHDDSDSICYQTSDNAENWSDAQDKCKSVGANLASIHSSQENTYIRRLAVSRGLVDGLLLGATTSGKGNSFGWLDGSDWNYTNFIPGFPIDGFGDCLVMDTSDPNGLWANNDCNAKLPFVCSRKPFTDSPPQTCLGADIKEGDIVRTPGFPTDANTYCDFFLKVDTGKLVEIEVLLVEANTCCDNFIIYEGSFGGNIIANLTGAVGGLTFRTTSSNMMRASWQPNGGVNVRGAMFTFRGV